MKTALRTSPIERNSERLGYAITFLDGENTELYGNGDMCTIRVLSELSEEELLNGFTIYFDDNTPVEVTLGE